MRRTPDKDISPQTTYNINNYRFMYSGGYKGGYYTVAEPMITFNNK